VKHYLNQHNKKTVGNYVESIYRGVKFFPSASDEAYFVFPCMASWNSFLTAVILAF
jgi:hypothetical protein